MAGKGTLYFAYGSNLSTAQMRRRCPRSTPIGLAYLPGWTWIINERRYANIVPNASPHTPHIEPTDATGVYGLVYRLHPADEVKLDICEGVGFAYDRQMLEVAWADISASSSTHGKAEARPGEGSTLQAPGKLQTLVYVDSVNVNPSAPWDEYVDRMNAGIQEASEQWGMPAAYVDGVIRPYIPAPSKKQGLAAPWDEAHAKERGSCRW
ncbi:hypothetical protein F4802DRAFT_583663 [Xylaria palmicola]|nr:hypothetical protein F4802DRAFT_583663 [Xylaria palmicola]